MAPRRSVRIFLDATVMPASIAAKPGIDSRSAGSNHSSGESDSLPATLPPLTGPIVSLSPTSLDFGNQNVGVASVPQAVTLTNIGDASLSLTSIRISSSNSGDFSQTNSCGKTVAAGSNCTINITFIPTKTGARTSKVAVTDNAPGSPQTLVVNGTGVAPAATLSPTNLSFAGVTVGKSSDSKPVTLTNTGTGDLAISSVTVTGDFSQTNPCPATLTAGASCAVSVTFSPAAAWSRGGSVVISDNAYNNPQQIVVLVGMGNSGADATVTPSSMNWGNQIIRNREFHKGGNAFQPWHSPAEHQQHHSQRRFHANQ